MEDQQVTFSRILILLTVYSIAVAGYQLKCPGESQWIKRAKARCYVKKQYHCFLDKSENMSMEICLEPDYLPEGFKSIYSGNRDAKVCSSKRFSPFISMTSDRNECVYQKSLCSEEGQLLFDNGTKLQDVSCGCDYTRGYRFFLKPNHACFCYPRIEDCSCFQTACKSGEVLSKDYACVHANSKNTVSTCPENINTRIKNENKQQVKTITTNPIRPSVNGTVPAILLTFLMLTTIIFALVLIKKVCTPEAVVDLSLIHDLEQLMKQQSFVILKGREGTGKTTFVRYLLEKYRNDGYKIIKMKTIKGNTLNDVCKDVTCNYLLFFEDITDSSNCFATIKLAFEQMQMRLKTDRKTVVVITMKHLPRKYDVKQIISEYLENEFNKDHIIFDLEQKHLGKMDKEKILRFHLTKKRIIPRCVDKNLQKQILEEETYIGFPGMCASFCSHKDHIKLGLKYFKQPPPSLLSVIDSLKEDGFNHFGKAYTYCLLINILLSTINAVDHGSANDKIKSSINQIYKTIWQSIDLYSASCFQNQIKELCPDFIIVDDRSKVRFVSSVVQHAVMVSYFKVCSSDVLEKCKTVDVITYLRPLDYKPLHGEIFLKCSLKEYQTFAKRVASEIQTRDQTEKIVKKLVPFATTSEGMRFLNLIEEELKSTVPHHFTSYLPFIYSFGQCLRQRASKAGNKEIVNFNLAWEYVCAKSKNDNSALEQIISSVNDSMCDVLLTHFDKYKNSLAHYIVIWSGERERELLSKLLSRFNEQPVDGVMKVLTTENSQRFSPIHFAAYFGRYEFLSELKNVLQSRNEKHQSSLPVFVKILNATCLTDNDQNDETITPLGRLKNHLDLDLYNLQSNVRFGDKNDFEKIKQLVESETNI